MIIILLENGDMFSWGNNSFGKLGTPKEILTENTPSQILSLRQTSMIFASLGDNAMLVSTGQPNKLC